jgi:hypothetical protein
VFAHSPSRLKYTLLIAAFVMVGLGTWGIARAQDGPSSVPGTVAGMPPTAQGAGWAVVRGVDGVRIRQFRTTGSVRLGLGQYRVTFAQAVNGCEFDATIGDIGIAFEPPGEITVRIGPAVNLVDIFTFTPAGGLSDRDFHLSVNC